MCVGIDAGGAYLDGAPRRQTLIRQPPGSAAAAGAGSCCSIQRRVGDDKGEGQLLQEQREEQQQQRGAAVVSSLTHMMMSGLRRREGDPKAPAVMRLGWMDSAQGGQIDRVFKGCIPRPSPHTPCAHVQPRPMCVVSHLCVVGYGRSADESRLSKQLSPTLPWRSHHTQARQTRAHAARTLSSPPRDNPSPLIRIHTRHCDTGARRGSRGSDPSLSTAAGGA